MIDIPSLRPETRYGIPTCDQMLFNRNYIVGYSYLFRQPRWALQVIDDLSMNSSDDFDRLDNFREDLRVPDMFRSTLKDYKGSGYDRGHLINSADRMSSEVINSETFLLSNMAPQTPDFNRKIWLHLEDAVRKLAARKEIMEVYTMCGPLFSVGDEIEVIGENNVVVPDAFFKCVLAERAKPNSVNQLEMWAFAIPNVPNTPFANATVATRNAGKAVPADYLVSTEFIERWAGLQIWDRLRGERGARLKTKKNKMWEPDSAFQPAESSKKKSAKKKKTTAKNSSKKSSKKKAAIKKSAKRVTAKSAKKSAKKKGA